jgi:hypothetical protein
MNWTCSAAADWWSKEEIIQKISEFYIMLFINMSPPNNFFWIWTPYCKFDWNLVSCSVTIDFFMLGDLENLHLAIETT